MENGHADAILEQKRITKRPLSISIICVLGFIASLFAIAQTLMFFPSIVGVWVPFLVVIASFVTMINLSGLWLMKRWAAYTFVSFFVINQFLLVILGAWRISSFISPAIATLFVLMHTERMK